VQARNREAGRIGEVYLRYDRTCGRYYDVDNQVDNKDACPIRPLAESQLADEPSSVMDLDGETIIAQGNDVTADSDLQDGEPEK
jgi:hypothetical protein